jgi:hypothetical protein
MRFVHLMCSILLAVLTHPDHNRMTMFLSGPRRYAAYQHFFSFRILVCLSQKHEYNVHMYLIVPSHSLFSTNPNNPVVIFHSLSIASLTPECIHLVNPSTGRIDSSVNYGYLFTWNTREKEAELLNVCKLVHVRWND